jgi:hypothetical protein
MTDLEVDFSNASPVAVSAVDQLAPSVADPAPLSASALNTLLSHATTLFQEKWNNFIAGNFPAGMGGCGTSSCQGCAGGGGSKRTLVQNLTITTEWYLLTKLFTSGFDSSRVLEDIRYIVGKFHTSTSMKEAWEPAAEYQYLHPEALGVIMFYSCQAKPAADAVQSPGSTVDNALYSSIIDRSARVRDLFATFLSGSSFAPDAALRTELFTLLYGLVPDVVTDSKAVAASTRLSIPDSSMKAFMTLLGFTSGAGSLGGLAAFGGLLNSNLDDDDDDLATPSATPSVNAPASDAPTVTPNLPSTA